MTPSQIQFYGLCIQAGALFVSLVAASLIINWNIRIARRRATLDILLNEQTHEGAIKDRTTFEQIKEKAAQDKADLSEWASPEKISTKEVESIRSTLNRYELVAIGIKSSALNENIYKGWCRTTLVEDWISLKSFVETIRDDNDVPTYFCEFERLAQKWAKGSEKGRV